MPFLDDDDDVEHIVNKWADALGLGRKLPRDAIAALEAMKFGRYIRGYFVVPDANLPNAMGQHSDGEIMLRQSTYDAARRKEPAAQWVIFEEIGHAALRHSGTRNFSLTRTATERFSSKAKREEAEARRFAATIMAPYDLVGFTEHMTTEDLQRIAHLPKKAAEYRLEELGRIYRRRTRRLRPLPQVALDFLQKGPTPPAEMVGDPCPNPTCGRLTMVRDGLGARCLSCGTKVGRD